MGGVCNHIKALGTPFIPTSKGMPKGMSTEGLLSRHALNMPQVVVTNLQNQGCAQDDLSGG